MSAPPTARLGDDLPAAPRMGQPLNVVVARTEVVAGKVHLELDAPQAMRGNPGGKLLVKHVYRLQEHSKEREEYRILLKSILNGKEHPPSLARFGDNYARTDDYSGFLVHEYTLPVSGEAVLEFDVGAEYTVGDWKTDRVDTHDVQRQGGVIRIHVA